MITGATCVGLAVASPSDLAPPPTVPLTVPRDGGIPSAPSPPAAARERSDPPTVKGTAGTTKARGAKSKARRSNEAGTAGKERSAHVARRPAKPVQVVIPRLQLEERLVRLGQKDGVIDSPRDPDRVGWYAGGSRPGEPGAAVLAGHVDDAEGPAVFYHLSALRPGDRVLVRRTDGSTARFRVTKIRRYPKDNLPLDVFSTTKPELRLITCGGAFEEDEYADNVVVYAARA